MRTTKQQLQQQVEELRAECDRLRTENAALRSDRSAAVPPKQRPKFVVSPEEAARRADIATRMAEAKAEAIRTGRTVLVRS